MTATSTSITLLGEEPEKDRCLAYSFYKQGVGDRRTAIVEPCFEALATLLRRPLPSGIEDDRVHQLARFVVERPTIIVLDGVEVLQGVPDRNGEALFRDAGLPRFFAQLARLSAAGGQRVLVVLTSRLRPMSGAAESALNPKWLSEPKEVRPLVKRDAIRLLYSLATGTESNPVGIEKEKCGKLVDALKRNALAVTALGSHIAEVHGGNIDAIPPNHVSLRGTKHSEHAQKVLKRILSDYENPNRHDLLALLRLLGLFQRPATIEELTIVIAHLVSVGIHCPIALDKLRDGVERLAAARLITAHGNVVETHPLLRAGYAESLRQWSDAFSEGHIALYNLYTRRTIEATTPIEVRELFGAIRHALASGRATLIEESFSDVYWRRCQHNKGWSQANYAYHQLGMVSEGHEALSDFFELNGAGVRLKPSLSLPPLLEARLSAAMAVYLRARGMLDDAVRIMGRASTAFSDLAGTSTEVIPQSRLSMEAITNDESISEICLLRLDGKGARRKIGQALNRFNAVKAKYETLAQQAERGFVLDLTRREISVRTAYADVLQHFGDDLEVEEAGAEFRLSYQLFRSSLFADDKRQLTYPVRPLYWFGYQLERSGGQQGTVQAILDEINELAAAGGHPDLGPYRPYAYWGVLACYATDAHRQLQQWGEADRLVAIAIESLRLADVNYHKPRGWVAGARLIADELANGRPIRVRQAELYLAAIRDLYKRQKIDLYHIDELLIRAEIERLKKNANGAKKHWRDALSRSTDANYTRGIRLCQNLSSRYLT